MRGQGEDGKVRSIKVSNSREVLVADLEQQRLMRDLITVSKGEKRGGIQRYPVGSLVFEESALGNKLCPTLGKHDGAIYCIGLDGKLEKFDTIDSSSPSISGTTFDFESYYYPQFMYVTPQGVCIASHDTASDKAFILYAENIESELVVVKEYDGEGIRFVDRFGHDCYYNGLETLILIGEYGFSPRERELLLSTDGGQSYNTIKTTPLDDPTVNSHWHGVSYDHYHGIIWASSGDKEVHAKTMFSPDLGETWYTLNTKLWSNDQPTMIVPFPDKVLFGRDHGTVGTHTFDKSLLNNGYSNLPEECYGNVLNIRHSAGFTGYAQGVSCLGKEAYFVLASELSLRLHPVIATGDFGNSVHLVNVSFSSTRYIRDIWGVDEKYVYGTTPQWSNTTPRAGKLVYAKRIEFVS